MRSRFVLQDERLPIDGQMDVSFRCEIVYDEKTEDFDLEVINDTTVNRQIPFLLHCKGRDAKVAEKTRWKRIDDGPVSLPLRTKDC